MKRYEFEHVIAAAADVVEDEIVVIGSQAIHAQFDSLPEPLLVSREVDVYPRSHPERAAEIDGAIGDGSRFDSTYGYYAHGVGPEAAKAPAGWEQRLIRLEIRTRVRGRVAVAWCMEAHDLVLAKLAAGRAHDVEFATEALRARLVDPEQLLLGLKLMPGTHRVATEDRLAGVLRLVGTDAS